jgi:hypothetical protein
MKLSGHAIDVTPEAGGALRFTAPFADERRGVQEDP